MDGFVAAAQQFDMSRDVTWFLETAFVQGVETFVLGVLIEDRKSETKTVATN
jgi:hypothetical protein